MKIIECLNGSDRDGNDRYYLKIENEKGDDYIVSFTIINKKIVKQECDCLYGTYEIGRKVKTYKKCRHIKFAIKYLRDGRII